VRLALDTNAYVGMLRNDPAFAGVIEQAEKVCIPFVVLAELRGGFLRGSRADENERKLSQFLNKPEVEALYADEQTTHHDAKIYFQLRKQGTPIPVNDMWIAALVAQHDLILLARDQHFDHLRQIPRL